MFAAAEEQASPEQPQATAPQAMVDTAPTATPPDEMTLEDALLALARQEGAGVGWGEWQPVIPPASSSLAWMAAEIERQPLQCFSLPEPAGHARAAEADALAAEADVSHTSSRGQASIQFGDVRGQRQTQRPPIPVAPHGDMEVSQLPLF